MPDGDDFAAALRVAYAIAGTVSDAEAERLFGHYELLLRWNRVLNLTRVAELPEAVERHYCESLFAADHLPAGTGSVLDVGSGAGFPGIPIAVRRPECRVVLAESHVRKSVFLREATRDLPNVTVVADRADRIRDHFECIVSRAIRWEEVVEIASRAVMLLAGSMDAQSAVQDRRFEWQPAVVLPWGRQRVLLRGLRVCST